MMRKICLFFLVLIFIPGISIAQNLPVLLPKHYQPIDTAKVSDEEESGEQADLRIKNREKLEYGVTLGTSFSSINNYGSMTSSYIAPHINYAVGPKLQLTFNAIYMDNNYAGEDMLIMNNPYSYQYLTDQDSWGINVGGVFELSEKFSIYGAGTYFNNESIMMNTSVSPYQQGDYKSVSLGVNYKLSKNISIGAQFNMNNASPYFNNFHSQWNDPFYNGMFYSPY